MAKKQITVTAQSKDGGTATFVSGNAWAIGEDTFTSVDAVETMRDRGEVTIATGEVTAIAAASGDESTYTEAITDVWTAGADVFISKTYNKSGSGDGSSYDVSHTRFKAIDVEHLDRGTKVIQTEKTTYDAHVTSDIDGNVAIATFDAQAIGEDTFVSAPCRDSDARTPSWAPTSELGNNTYAPSLSSSAT